MFLILIVFIVAAFYMMSIHETLDYDFISYITVIMNMFIMIYYLVKYRKYNLICFELFFSLAFFAATYSYFIISDTSTGYTTSLMVSNVTKESTFGLAIIVSSIAYYFFILGCVIANARKSNTNKYNNNYTYNRVIENAVCVLYILVFLIFLSRNLNSYLYSKSQVVDVSFSGIRGLIFWVNLLLLLYSIVVFMNNKVLGVSKFKDFVISNKLYSILWLILVFIHLISGHRHHALTIIISNVFLYSLCIKKIPILRFLIGIAIGVWLFSFIGFMRSGVRTVDEYELQVNGVLRDFVPASLATPFFIEYTDNYGYTYGANYFLSFVGVIPFLAGLLKRTGLYVTAPTSYDFFTEYVTNDDASGLGTSLVGDLYYSWGMIGVFIGFCFLGFFVSWLYKKIVVEHSSSPYHLIAYIVMMSVCIFLSRADFISFFRTISLLCIIYYFLYIFFSRNKT